MQQNNPIIFFDGVCNLCNASIQFVIKRDVKGYFKFSALQSDLAKQYIPDLNSDDLDTIILLENGKLYKRSTAALRIAKKLNGLWSLMYVFVIVPPFIRNAIYNYIAKNRYKWWGRQEQCWMPTEGLKDRFVG